jgi:predicted homoserine dehydrogenase-like protein
VLRAEPTGTTRGWRGDAVAVTKRALKAGEMLDGEGGYTVYGRLMQAAESRARRALPIGLAHGVRLTRDVAAGQPVTEADVTLDESQPIVSLRRELTATAW